MIDIGVSDLLEAIESAVEFANEGFMASQGLNVRLRYLHGSVTHLG